MTVQDLSLSRFLCGLVFLCWFWGFLDALDAFNMEHSISHTEMEALANRIARFFGHGTVEMGCCTSNVVEVIHDSNLIETFCSSICEITCNERLMYLIFT